MGEVVDLNRNCEYDDLYESRISIMIKHPTIHLEIISQSLAIEPHFGWTNGDPIVTPSGLRRSGTRVGTYWTYSTDKYKSRDFFKPLGDIVDILYIRKDFIIKLNSGGGTLSITARLSGRNNIGSIVEPKVLQRICDMNALLGVEVFPDF